MGSHERFRRFAGRVADATGSARTFMLAITVIAAWAITGPLFHFNDSWQLVINTSTTIVTFLMVFLIQNTQNRDNRAIHLKLDELIRAQKRARNSFADIENAPDEELRSLQEEFVALRKAGMGTHEAGHEAVDRSLGPHGRKGH